MQKKDSCCMDLRGLDKEWRGFSDFDIKRVKGATASQAKTSSEPRGTTPAAADRGRDRGEEEGEEAAPSVVSAGQAVLEDNVVPTEPEVEVTDRYSRPRPLEQLRCYNYKGVNYP